jgi:N-sulfoglucosamine sulfohydrolase
MNIVYLHSHDTGRHVQPYGFGVSTPNIQRLAEDGVLFRQAFCAAPTCSPSRAALLTGQSPHSAGMLGLAHRGFRLNDPNQHLAHVLRDQGFATVLAGTQHVTVDDPHLLGYESVLSPKDTSVANVAPIAADYLRNSQGHSAEPFFLDIGFSETHRPFSSVNPQHARFVRVPCPMPDTPDIRQDTAEFHASIQELDRGVGIVLDTLETAGLSDSTVVVLTTDHGPAFPMMKCNLTDHGTGVMLIMRGLHGISGGKVIDGLVSHVDLFPTLCELIGIAKPAWLQGVSVMPLIHGEQHEVREEVLGEVTFHAAFEPQRSIRTKRWTYIRRYGDRSRQVLANVDVGVSREFLLQQGWENCTIEPEQLYDNILDPNQRSNLNRDPDLMAIKAELAGRLEHWMRETDDPLVAGSIELPPGASMNRTSARSADEELVSGPRVDSSNW